MGSKNKNIHLQDFKDVDFNFTHFANFEFAYFEIEGSFGLIRVKLQNGRFHLQTPFWVLKRWPFQVNTLFLLIFWKIEILGKFG